MDSVKTLLLSHLCKSGFACCCAVLGFNSHFKILLCAVGNNFAEKLCKLSGMLCLFVSSLFPIETDLGIALSVSNSCHCKIHANL